MLEGLADAIQRGNESGGSNSTGNSRGDILNAVLDGFNSLSLRSKTVPNDLSTINEQV